MKVVCSILVLLINVASYYSQGAPATEERAKQLRYDSYKILAGHPHRVKITIERRASEDAPWELYSTMTEEVATPKRRHVVQQFGPGTIRREYIYIDRQTYMRLLPDGPWQLLPANDTGATVRQLGGVASHTIDDRKDGKVIDGQSKGKLEIIRTGEIVEINTNTKEWFDDDGRLIRSQIEQWNTDQKHFSRRTQEYEYDSTITVDAPLIN